jgi:hypothetical protein
MKKIFESLKRNWPILFLAVLAIVVCYFNYDPTAPIVGFLTIPLLGSVKISERFAKTCQVVYHNNYDTCGTITRTDIDYLTPATLESLFAPGGSFADLQAWFKTAFEMKACGTQVNGMYEWIMSGADREGMKNLLSVQKVQKNPSFLFPFIMGIQESVINTESWYISTGQAQSAYTALVTGPLTAGDLALGGATDRVFRVKSRYSVEADAKWFRDRDRIFVLGRSGIGVAQRGQWKVLASETSADKTYVDVLVTSENAGSTQPYDTAPTSGLVLIGVNNVNDFEKWCNNRANFDGTKEVPFWWQTMRRTRCVDQPYKEFYGRLMTEGVNEAFKRFGDMTLAQRNAQDEAMYQRAFVRAFFFQKAISASQTTALWKNLESISTPTGFAINPGTGGKVIAKRANFIGVVEQLRDCDRYRDLQGLRLNFYEWLDENYRIKRSRETNNKSVASIDWYTDEVTAANMITAYTEYLKKEYGSSNVQFPIDITKTFTNALGFAWRTMYVKFPAGVAINIVTHKFFNDLRDAYKTENMESAGINLWCLDWGNKGIYWAQLGSNRKSFRVGDLNDMAPIDKDWACVMETLTQEITLNSESGAAVVQCPNDSIIITGIADGVPDVTGKSSSGGGSYLDLATYSG